MNQLFNLLKWFKIKKIKSLLNNYCFLHKMGGCGSREKELREKVGFS